MTNGISNTRLHAVLGTAILLSVAAAFSGCASSRLVDVWKDPAYTKHLSNVFVIAVKKDPARRRIWEDGLANALRKHGVAATPSYQLFPDQLPDTTQVVETVGEKGFDGVIVTVGLRTQTQHTYVPGYVTTVPVTRYDRWWNVYRTYYRRVYRPGYYDVQTVARARTDVWTTAGDGTLIWTGPTDVYDPTSSKNVSDEITERIMPELADQGIIPKRG
jgi:hypothetical protein